jgi:predicted enzyme related to lactoylglutathione lyase
MVPLLQVFDMPSSLRFYVDILGFKVEQSSGSGYDVDWVLLRLNDMEIMLNTAYEKLMRPANPDLSRKTAHNDTSLYFGCPDIEKTYSYLSQQGVDLKKPELTGYGWRALNFTDPDGYHICMHWPVKQVE